MGHTEISDSGNYINDGAILQSREYKRKSRFERR